MIHGRICLSALGNHGKNCVIRGGGVFLRSENIILGEGVQIGKDAFFVAQGGIEIGDYSIISRRVTIRTQDHVFECDSLPFGDECTYAPVKIGTSVWIGMGASIMPGVTIGDGAIVGYQSLVTHDVPECAIVVGSPAKVIKYRDKERFLKNVELENFKAKRESRR